MPKRRTILSSYKSGRISQEEAYEAAKRVKAKRSLLDDLVDTVLGSSEDKKRAREERKRR